MSSGCHWLVPSVHAQSTVLLGWLGQWLCEGQGGSWVSEPGWAAGASAFRVGQPTPPAQAVWGAPDGSPAAGPARTPAGLTQLQGAHMQAPGPRTALRVPILSVLLGQMGLVIRPALKQVGGDAHTQIPHKEAKFSWASGIEIIQLSCQKRRHHLPQEPGGFYRFRNISSTPAKPSLYVWDPRTWELIPPAADGSEGADRTL